MTLPFSEAILLAKSYTVPLELSVEFEPVFINEGETANNTIFVSNPVGVLELNCDHGTVSDNEDGTWSWEFTPEIGFGGELHINIYAKDDVGVATTEFPLYVKRVPTPEEILDKVDLGLHWMVGEQNPDGSWNGKDYPLSSNEPVAYTGFVLTKLCDYAYEQGYSSPFDPQYEYSPNVIAGYDYLFSQAKTRGEAQPGIFMHIYLEYSHHETYNASVALMAIAATLTPDKIINHSNPLVNGLTFLELAEQMVLYFEHGQQQGSFNSYGGWNYDAGAADRADNSNTGFAVLGLRYAEAFGCEIPPIIKERLSVWIDFIQNDNNGGSGYDHPESMVNMLKTGNLLFEMAFVGDPITEPRVQNALNYIQYTWDHPEDDLNWAARDIHCLYLLMKGFESYSIDFIHVSGEEINWFDEFATQLYYIHPQVQEPDGNYWVHGWFGDRLLNTCWALYVLEKVAPPPPGEFVDFDIHPTSWPNPINANTGGVVPAAILGTVSFDVTTIDPSTLLLEGVAPIRWAVEDVARPAGGDGECNDTEEGPDGFDDLTLKFDTRELVAALGSVYDGDALTLTIIGKCFDGQDLKGDDCVIIKGNKLEKESATPADTDIPTDFELLQNHPNPFNPTTQIEYALPEARHVTLKIFNMSGQQIRELVSGQQSVGIHTIEWDATDEMGIRVPSGLYIYVLKAGNVFIQKKMMLMK